LGQPVIIENVGNAVARPTARQGAPDGYHFNLGGTSHMAFHTTIYRTPVYVLQRFCSGCAGGRAALPAGRAQ
jgi:hypothetical protein